METGTVNLYNADLTTTEYGKLLQKFIRKDGFAANMIESYNNEITVKLKEAIEQTNITTRYGVTNFSNITFRKPKIESGGVDIDMSPRIARERVNPYFSEIRADITYTPNAIMYDNGIAVYDEAKPVEVMKQELIGSIPVMLGSDICHLGGKSPAEKMDMGECFNDILGYFYIRGEKIIINQELLRLSSFLIYYEPAPIDCVVGKITCPTNLGTSQNKIMITKHSALIVYLSHLDKGPNSPYPPLFAVFKVLGLGIEDATDLILSFLKEEYHEAAFFQLAATRAEYDTLIEGSDSLDILVSKLLDRRQSKKNDLKSTVDNVIKDIEKDLFSSIPLIKDKIMHLAMYSARILEYMIGVRELDDRNSYANKKIETPGTKLSQLFKALWSEIIKGVSITSIDAKNLRDIVNNMKPNDVKRDIISAFGPNAWGTKKIRKKENVTEALKRDTPIAVYSQIGKINIKANRRMQSIPLRMPHGSQLGYIDPFETPEGSACGLVRNISCTCYVSLERDPEEIYRYVNTDYELMKYMFPDRYEKFIPVLLNGIIRWWAKSEKAGSILKNRKNRGFIHKDVCIFFNKKDSCIEITCNSGRATRPLLIVDENCQLVIDKKKLWNAEIPELITSGCIEYVDAREQEWIYLAETIHHVHKRKYILDKIAVSTDPEEIKMLNNELSEFIPYTHSEVDPTAMFGISANLIPQANRQAGPRTAYQSASMNKQALGQYHSNEQTRFDTSYKMLYYPTKPLFQTDLQDTAGQNLMPNGIMAQVAIMAHRDNPEDGIILKQEAVKYANKFDLVKKTTALAKISTLKGDFTERFTKPAVRVDEREGKYAAIDDNGMPRIDAYIRPFDCVIGKVREYNKNSGLSTAGTIENISECSGIGEEGYIDRVLITKNISTKEDIVKVKIRQNRKYIPGDKASLRYSQKGTIARIIPARDLPRVASGPLKGMVPDVIINPHSQPSRMTMNMMIEILVSKAAAIDGHYINSTTFRDFDDELRYAQEVLEKYGLDKSGKEEFELPGGTKMIGRSYFGPCYYQALRHHVVDKIQMRARGAIVPSTRQPVHGRAKEGGLKIGEMERDALISHGSSGLLRERLCEVSDAYNLPVCKCGVIAITNHAEGIYKCNMCGPAAKIGVIRIPYVVKLLMFYLNGAGIHMKFKVSEVEV